MIRTLVALTLALGACACASKVVAPQVTPAPPVPPPVVVSFAEKQAWILRLEDQRILRETLASDPPPPVVPDLLGLLTDEDSRIRRRAALAVGRVGLKDGVSPLLVLLGDREPEVRQMAAFALGLIGDGAAKDALVTSLGDEAPVVRGSAAEALGLIGDASAGAPIARMASQILESGGWSTDGDLDDRRDTPSAAFRLALFALVRLKAYEPLASVVLDAQGQPRVRTWPVAFALQRIEDPRALNALVALAAETNPYTRAFAAKGLGGLKATGAVSLLTSLVSGPDRSVSVEAIRALGRIGDPSSAPALIKVMDTPKADPVLRSEAASALGTIGGEGTTDALLDFVSDRDPVVRAAVLRSLAQLDAEGFVIVLSGLDPDPQATVRMALASVLGTVPAEAALPRLRSMLQDPDPRVIPPVLASLAKLKAPEIEGLLLDRLKVDDAVVRAAAATAFGELKPSGGAAALSEAYRRGAETDTTYVARAAALTALAVYGAAEATPTLIRALEDRDWAVRVRAAALLKTLDPSIDAEHRIRPAPSLQQLDARTLARLANPPIATQAYIETDAGLIHLEFAMNDAPMTVETFVTLARKGFFDGLTFHRVVADFVVQGGDPRGDGEGGPGFTIRDELGQRTYLRGTVGMALDWEDTGGSQFFITHSPQPHLDGKYTVFGRVLAGMDVVDRIRQGDVIRRVTIWDGT